MFKCYICLLTFATTRNVHLELSSSMDSSKVFRCLKYLLSRRGCVLICLIAMIKRLLARRGCVNMFNSDDYSAFKLNEVANFLCLNDINWKYILSLSPWWEAFTSV